MFGFLALGFFTAMALKNNGNGGNGGGLFAGILASLVSIKGIKETLAELGWGKKKKEEEEENTSSSSDGIGGGDYEEDFGINGLDEGKEQIDERTLNKNRALAMMQRSVEQAQGEDKEKAQKQYDAYLSCLYNDDGTEKDEQEMNVELEKLEKDDPDTFNAIKDNVKKIGDDPKQLEGFTEDFKQINPNQAAAAAEQAQTDRLRIKMNKDLADIDKKIRETDSNTTISKEDKDKALEDLKKQRQGVIDSQETKIKEHEKQAKKLRDTPYTGTQTARENDEIKDGLDELKANREERKKLGGDNAVSYMTSEYDKYNSGIEGFSISDITSGTLSHDDDERLTAICKEKGIDRGSLEAYYAYKQADPKDKDKKKKAFEDKLRKQISKRCDELDKEYDQKRSKLQEKVNKHNESLNKNKQEGTNGTNDSNGTNGSNGTTDPNEVIKTVKKFEKQENDKEWYPEIDEDGDPTGNFAVCVVKEKDEDGNEVLKYVMRDNSGEEVEISKEDFETHKTNFNEFKEELNPEDEEKLDNALDETYTETEEEKNSDEGKEAERDETNGKRVNPAKIWHKKKNKNTGKSTKNYYNKKGDSISSDEYHKRIENYKAYVQKHKNQVQDKNSLTDYLRDKMVVEHFTPKNDISEYLKSCF